MPNPIYSPDHQWAVAAMIDIDSTVAAEVAATGYLGRVIAEETEVLDLMCKQCRKRYDQVFDQRCLVAAEGNEHLRGGPIGTRRKRWCPEHKALYTVCAAQHTSPIDYGRAPMPSLRLVNDPAYRRPETQAPSRP